MAQVLQQDHEPAEIPKNIEAEKVVLGAALIDPKTCAPVIVDRLCDDYFYVARHKVVFRVMQALTAKGSPTDILSVADMLEERGDMERAGGRLYLNELLDSVTTTASLDYYADLIIKKAQQRNLIEAGGVISELATSEDPEEALRKAAELIVGARLVGSDPVDAPIVNALDNAVTVEWVSRQITAEAVSLKEDGYGNIKGHLTFTTTLPGINPQLSSASFNFSSLQTREKWAKTLNGRVSLPNWQDMIEELCRAVTEHILKGEPVQEFAADDDVEPARYALHPLLLVDHPVIIFGHRAVAKSYTALLLMYLASITGGDEDLGFDRQQRFERPMYLDWEGDRDSVSWRAKLLANGMRFPGRKFDYLKCTRGLATDADRIRRELMARGTDFVVVDSLGFACGGDLNSPQPAVDFYNALRSLRISSLIIAHTAKAGGHNRTVFGSSFFENGARSIWEMVRDQHEGEDQISVGLFHRKMNYGPLERAVGLRWSFSSDATRVRREDVREMAGMEEALPATEQIVRLLLREAKPGGMSPKMIADTLDIPQAKVRGTLSYLSKSKRIVSPQRGKWAALAVHDEGEYS